MSHEQTKLKRWIVRYAIERWICVEAVNEDAAYAVAERADEVHWHNDETEWDVTEEGKP